MKTSLSLWNFMISLSLKQRYEGTIEMCIRISSSCPGHKTESDNQRGSWSSWNQIPKDKNRESGWVCGGSSNVQRRPIWGKWRINLGIYGIQSNRPRTKDDSGRKVRCLDVGEDEKEK